MPLALAGQAAGDGGGQVRGEGAEGERGHGPSLSQGRAGATGEDRYNPRPPAPSPDHPMFESLTQRLSSTIDRLRGRARLTEENIREATREVRIALLEADVALPVVQALIERIKVRAVGQDVMKSLTPGQALVKVVRDELTA